MQTYKTNKNTETVHKSSKEKELADLTDEELLARAHRLALESLVEQMENGEYISSGNLSYLNTVSKNSGIKTVVEESNGNGIGEKIQDLLKNKTNVHTQHKKEA